MPDVYACQLKENVCSVTIPKFVFVRSVFYYGLKVMLDKKLARNLNFSFYYTILLSLNVLITTCDY